MPELKLHFDTSILPTDVLSLCDGPFYEIVQKIAGEGEAKLLQVQGIRSVYSFLNTEDVFEILSVPCNALKAAKELVCLEANDKTFMVKPGCRSSVRYLYQLLQQKHEEHMKQITKQKKTKCSYSQSTNSDSLSISQDSRQDISISITTDINTTTSNTASTFKHHAFIIRTLNEWFDRNRAAMNMPTEKLVENEDFQLLLVFNGSSEEACVSCSCGIKVQLTKRAENLSLSNFYKHIKSKTCAMVKKKKLTNTNANDDLTTTIDVASFDDDDDGIASLNVSVNEQIRSSTASSTTDAISKTMSSSKRSTISSAKVSSKRQRI